MISSRGTLFAAAALAFAAPVAGGGRAVAAPPAAPAAPLAAPAAAADPQVLLGPVTSGGGAGSGLPFTLTYIGVDEAKREPAAAVAAAGLKYVPTLIVRRDGREVGRIVESAPHGVEIDLLALLSGKAAGLLTANPKLTAAGSAPPSAAPPRR